MLTRPTSSSGSRINPSRESVIIYVGNELCGVKWRNWKMMLKGLDNATSEVKSYGIPRFYDLYVDPKEEHPQDPRVPENLWVRYPMVQVLLGHVASLHKEPPIRPGRPTRTFLRVKRSPLLKRSRSPLIRRRCTRAPQPSVDGHPRLARAISVTNF